MPKVHSVEIRKRKNAFGRCGSCSETILNGEHFFQDADSKYCRHCLRIAKLNNPLENGDIGFPDDSSDKNLYVMTRKGLKIFDISEFTVENVDDNLGWIEELGF